MRFFDGWLLYIRGWVSGWVGVRPQMKVGQSHRSAAPCSRRAAVRAAHHANHNPQFYELFSLYYVCRCVNARRYVFTFICAPRVRGAIKFKCSNSAPRSPNYYDARCRRSFRRLSAFSTYCIGRLCLWLKGYAPSSVIVRGEGWGTLLRV